MTETDESWVARIRAWRASGLSAERFAEGKGYAGSTLRYRAGKLASAATAQRARGVALRRVVRSPAPSSASTASSTPLLVHVGRASFAVTAGFDEALVRALVRCLSLEVG